MGSPATDALIDETPRGSNVFTKSREDANRGPQSAPAAFAIGFAAAKYSGKATAQSNYLLGAVHHSIIPFQRCISTSNPPCYRDNFLRGFPSMSHSLDRRTFLSSSTVAGAAIGLGALTTAISAAKEGEEPLFKISLAEWSFHRALRA